MAAIGSEDGLVKLWNLEISDFTANLRGQGAVSCVDIAPDEAFVASGSSSDRSVKIWSIIMTCVITDYKVYLLVVCMRTSSWSRRNFR